MKKRLFLVLSVIVLVAVAMTGVAMASATVTTFDYIYRGEYEHGIAGYNNDTVIIFGQATDIADEEYGIAIKSGEDYKYFKAEQVGTTGKYGVAFPADSIPDGEYVAMSYLKLANGDYSYGEEVSLVLDASGDYSVAVSITDGVASWIAPNGTYSTTVKLNGEVQEVSGTSFNVLSSEDYVAGENVVEIECLTKSGYVYTGSATMNIVAVTLDNIADLSEYGASDYLVLAEDITLPNDYFSTLTVDTEYHGSISSIAVVGSLSATFDGNGKTITYEDYTVSGTTTFSGIFAEVRSTAVVKNLKIVGSVTTDKDATGAIGYNFGLVKDCVFDVDVITKSESFGGIIGVNFYANPNYASSDRVTEDQAKSYGWAWGSVERCVAIIDNARDAWSGGTINAPATRGSAFGGVYNVNLGHQSFAKYTDLLFISPFATYPSKDFGVRNNVYMFTSSDDLFAGNGFEFQNDNVLGGYLNYNGHGNSKGNTATYAMSGKDWSDSVWVNDESGIWQMTTVESANGFKQILTFNGETILESSEITPTVQLEAGKLSWTDLGASEYEIKGQIDEGQEVTLATVNTNSYDLKQAVANQAGLATVKVIAKDSTGAEIITLTDSVKLVNNVATFKAISSEDEYIMLTANITATGDDYAVQSSWKALASTLNGVLDGAGYKVTATITSETTNNIATLFETVNDDAIIKNIAVDLTVAESTKVVYGVAGMMVGTVNDTVVTMNVNTSADDSVGIGQMLIDNGAGGSVSSGLIRSGELNRVIVIANFTGTGRVFGVAESNSWTPVYTSGEASKQARFNDVIYVASGYANCFAQCSGTKSKCYAAVSSSIQTSINNVIDGNLGQATTGGDYRGSGQVCGTATTGRTLNVVSSVWTKGAWNVTADTVTFFGNNIMQRV